MAAKGKSITLTYVAWNSSTNAPVTGDVANHTLRLVKDGTSAAPTNTPTEVDAVNAKGVYKLVLTSAETLFDVVTVCGVSATANVVLISTQVGFESTGVVTAGTAAAAAAGTLTLATGDGAKCAIGNTVEVFSATAGAGQARVILGIATDVVTLDQPWTTTPTGTVLYRVYATSLPTVLITLSGTPTATAFVSDRTETTDGYWKDSYVSFRTGTLAGQVKKCTAYTGASKTFTCNAFTGAPAAGDLAYVVNY